MNKRFEHCIERRQIYRNADATGLTNKELGAARQDLEDARESFRAGRYKWATIQAYYSMFHSLRALLYNEGFRERSHYCLAVAIETLFIKTGRLEESYLKRFEDVKSLREQADYALDFSKPGAEQATSAAAEFISKVSGLLEGRNQ